MDPDAECVRRALAGDREAFREIVERHQGPVWRFARGLLRDAHAAEDAAQEAFLSAWTHLREFDGERSRFSTWLFSIARNKCLNALKKGVPTPSDELPAPHDPATPADALERKELLERLDAALDSLPEEMKTAFVLTEFSGLSSEEVAEIQGVEPGTVRSRVSRARDRIREMCVPPP